jgi:hypothetical protein
MIQAPNQHIFPFIPFDALKDKLATLTWVVTFTIFHDFVCIYRFNHGACIIKLFTVVI